MFIVGSTFFRVPAQNGLDFLEIVNVGETNKNEKKEYIRRSIKTLNISHS